MGAGVALFVGCLGIQYLAYSRLLAAGLRQPAPEAKRAAVKRWFAFAVAWQVVVLVAIGAYAFPMVRSHPGGLAWLAPPLGAIAGTALPLQLAVVRISRAARA